MSDHGWAVGTTEVAFVPTVTSIYPTAGPLGGGRTVTISGTGFARGEQVLIGGAIASSVVIVDGSTMTATVPAGAEAAAVQLVVGTATTTSGPTYTYLPAPVVSAVSPSSGSVGGGASIEVTGAWFEANMSVSIGGQSASNLVLEDATHYRCTVPSSPSAGAEDVVVTTRGGSSIVQASDQFFYL